MATESIPDNSELIRAAEEFLASAKDFKGDLVGQMALVRQADKLRYLTENPMDTILRQWDTAHLTGALNVLVSTGALQKIPTEGTITAKELASSVGVDETVITRSMRLICVQGIAEEPEPDTYTHNAKSLAYITGSSQYFFKVVIDHDVAFTAFPKYLKTHTREDFFDRRKSPYAYGHGREGMTFYEVIDDDPERFTLFNQTLMQMEKTLPTVGMFPYASLKEQVEAEPERPFIVDVGGGRGQVVMSIQTEAPAGFGAEIILQDRPEVLATIPPESIPNVTKMAHDFFTPQPVKNAHLYMLRRILHDFYEPVCIEVVKNIASAMGPTSRLLIGDFLVPDKTQLGGDMMVYWMDFSMMMLTGIEKTEKQFRSILDAAGLELVKIWPYPIGTQVTVEAKLKSA